MKNMRFTPLSRAALVVLLCGCGGDLLVGEQRCYGVGVDCRSDAPTLDMPPADSGIPYEVIPARSVEPTWIYDPGTEQNVAQLARAPNGGIWLQLSSSTGRELVRISAEGEPVQLEQLNYDAQLSVDEELHPTLLAVLPSGHVMRTTLNPLGEVLDLPIGRKPLVTSSNGPALNILMAGPEGRVRIAKYNAQDYYVAEYDLLGDLVWKQSEFRGIRLPSTTVASYQAIMLSDGSVALGLPKPGPSIDVGGRSAPSVAQGITLIGSDGNVRWDVPLTISATSGVRLFPGSDGGVVFTMGWGDSMEVILLDRDGHQVAHWSGLRAGYYGLADATLCADPAGDLYLLATTGTRSKPEPTVCRMLASDPGAEVVCLSVPGAAQLAGGESMLGPMVAPDPGVVVLSTVEYSREATASSWRVARVDF